jgi:hypothetical protein
MSQCELRDRRSPARVLQAPAAVERIVDEQLQLAVSKCIFVACCERF